MCKSHPHLSLVGRCDETPDLFPQSRHSMPYCSVLPARRIGAGEDRALNGCIIPNGLHHDIHLSRLDDGTIVQWYDDWGCGCCALNEEGRCFVYSVVTDVREYQWLLGGRMLSDVMPPEFVKSWTLKEQRLCFGSENADTCWDCGEHIEPYDTCWIRWNTNLYSDGSRQITTEYRHDICPCDDQMEDEDSGDTHHHVECPIAA